MSQVTILNYYDEALGIWVPFTNLLPNEDVPKRVVDMTSPADLRALGDGKYSIYQNTGSTNVPGGVGVGGLLEIESFYIDTISDKFYSFTFTRASSTSTNSTVWTTTCSSATAAPLEWKRVLGIDDLPTFTQSVLWSGTWYMSDIQTANLSQSVTSQKNGIILVWSRYSGGTSHNDSWNYMYVPKWHVQNFAGSGVGYQLSSGGGTGEIRKYVYIDNNSIAGHAMNDDSPNNGQVLRYVLGY